MTDSPSAPSDPPLAGRIALPLNELALVLAIGLVFVLTGLIDRNHTYFTNFDTSLVIILRNTVLLGIIALGAAVALAIQLDGDHTPESATGNVESHQLLVQWFGSDKPK